MAEGKKSFIAYCDWKETFEELSDEEAGRLVKHLFKYVNDEHPETSDKLTKMCFIPIQQSLKRDLDKYDKYIDKQKVNGSKGGRPKKNPAEPKEPKPLFKNPTEPKKADSVSVSVSDNVNETNKSQQFEKELIEFAERFYNALEKYGCLKKRPKTISSKNLNDLKLMQTSDGFNLEDIEKLAAYYFHVGRCRQEAPFVIQSLSSFRKKGNSLMAAIKNHKG